MIEYRKAELSDIEVLTQMRLAIGEFKSLIRKNTSQFIESSFTDQSFVSWVALDGIEIVATGGINFFSSPPNHWCPN